MSHSDVCPFTFQTCFVAAEKVGANSWASFRQMCAGVYQVLQLFYFFFSSFFFIAGRVLSLPLRPYTIGPMRNPDIQNLLRGLCKPQERKIS